MTQDKKQMQKEEKNEMSSLLNRKDQSKLKWVIHTVFRYD